MTDRQFAVQKKRVDDYLHKWRNILNMWQDRLTIRYERRSHSDHSHTIGETWASWHYRNHAITFYMPEIAEIKDDSEVEEAVLHELVHILLHAATGNYDGKNEAEREKMEFAVQSTTLALIWAHKAGGKNE